MTREQIIEILETWDDYVLGGDIDDDIADAILAIPLEVPTDKEIDKWVDDEFCFNSPMYVEGVKKGMKQMRGEIIKRNK